MAGPVPAIHVLLSEKKAWMPGTRFILEPAKGRTRVPGMTKSSHASADFAWPTIASKAAGSVIARSESTLRSTTMPALASPAMNRL